MSRADLVYLNCGSSILENGNTRSDRTGTGTISTFGTRMEFSILEEFALLTTKKMRIDKIGHELLWFLAGDTNTKYLVDNGVHIWDDWADANGDCGPIYGSQWRSWQTTDGKHIDQISEVIKSLKNNPNSRRHIVSAWNVAFIDQMGLPPCHLLFQFYTQEATVMQRVASSLQARVVLRGTDLYGEALRGNPAALANVSAMLDDLHVPRTMLSCQLYQRSADYALGVPYNIASYEMLTMMIAQQVDMIPYRFIWVGGDTHLYLNHVEKFREQLERPVTIAAPTLTIRKAPSIFEYCIDDFQLSEYSPLAAINYEISV